MIRKVDISDIRIQVVYFDHYVCTRDGCNRLVPRGEIYTIDEWNDWHPDSTLVKEMPESIFCSEECAVKTYKMYITSVLGTIDNTLYSILKGKKELEDTDEYRIVEALHNLLNES